MMYLVLILVVVIALAAAAASKGKASGPRNYTLRKEFLNGAEQRLYYRLVEALPGYFVFPQVALSQVLQPVGNDNAARLAIAMLVSDFVILSGDFKVVAAFELDGRSHGGQKQQQRDTKKDAAFDSAGIKVHRIKHPKLPTVEEIRALVVKPQVPEVKTETVPV